MAESDSNQAMRLRTQLIVAAEKFHHTKGCPLTDYINVQRSGGTTQASKSD